MSAATAREAIAEPESSCNLCGAESLVSIGKIQGYRRNSFYAIIECKNCGASSASPREVDERIYDAIYSNVENVPGYARYHTLAEQIVEKRDPLGYIANVEESYYAVGKTLVDRVADRSRTTICEVGCGQGYLTYSLVKAGFRATGVDISQKAVELARSRYGDHYFCGSLQQFVERNSERPEYVVATELIEHLTDPGGFVAEMLAFLSPSGSLIITTPNKASCNGPIWDTELPPVHLWWLTKKGLVEMARKLSCSIEFIDLTEFYRRNVKFELARDSLTVAKAPVLNDDYDLIQSVPRELMFASTRRRLKGFLPTALIRKIQELRAGNSAMTIVNNENPRTLCAIYTKRQS